MRKPTLLRKSTPIALLALAALAFPAPARAQDSPGFELIINAANPATSLERSFVADAYLKKLTHWPDNDVIKPVDLKAESSVRRRFSEEVLDRSVMGIKGYWQRLIFSGTDVPPPELGTEQEVIQYVSRNPGAIGYVSGSALQGASGVRGIELR